MRKKIQRPKLKYEPEADVLSWEFSRQSIDYAKEAGNFIVHFSKKNSPVLVEILEASEFLFNARQKVTQYQPVLASSQIVR